MDLPRVLAERGQDIEACPGLRQSREWLCLGLNKLQVVPAGCTGQIEAARRRGFPALGT